jgi:hypothetical protein
VLNVHDEESDQVHGRLRRDAGQDRRLIINDTIPSTLFTQFWRLKYMSMKKNLIKSMPEIGEMLNKIGA